MYTAPFYQQHGKLYKYCVGTQRERRVSITFRTAVASVGSEGLGTHRGFLGYPGSKLVGVLFKPYAYSIICIYLFEFKK